MRDLEERIRREIVDKDVIQELIKAIKNSLERERILTLEDILNVIESQAIAENLE